MAELRLLFDTGDGTGDFTKVRAVYEPPDEAATFGPPIPFNFALSDDDYRELRWYLEEYMDLPDAGAMVRARRVEQSLEQWGRDLYGAVFDHADYRPLIDRLLAAPEPRLLTVGTDHGELLRLPWELMADRRGPLSARKVTIRRQLETAGETLEYRIGMPLRVLLVVSRPDDTGFIDPRHSTRAMLQTLEGVVDGSGRPCVRVDFCRPPTLDEMRQMLARAERQGEPYHAVHFDGHGTYDRLLGLGVLLFETAAESGSMDVKSDRVRADRLGHLLSAHQIPLVILEACRSAEIGAVAFRSVAPRLIEAGVGSVLAMSYAVHVEAAKILVDHFYRALVQGATIGGAVEEGRAGLNARPDRWLDYGPTAPTVQLADWFLPQLYQRGEDLVLVEGSGFGVQGSGFGVQGSDRYAFDVFLSHNHVDSERVERIAKRLRDEHGLKVFLDKWEIGPGPLLGQCERGIAASRWVLIVCSQEALRSEWVQAELDMARARDPRGSHVIPLVLEDVELPPSLAALRCYDFRNPRQDKTRIAELARDIGAAAAAVAPAPPEPAPARTLIPTGSQLGAFPAPPIHRFQGRARELHKLQRAFRLDRAVLLHAMGGMGKTTLAREAADWLTRTGLFADGACFISFEGPKSAERVVQVLGGCLEGEAFDRLSEADQRARAVVLFQKRRVLLVWDNFESVLPAFAEREGECLYTEEDRAGITALFRELTGDPEGAGRLLVTSRPGGEVGLAGVRRMELYGLERPDSLYLLAEVLRKHDMSLEDKRLKRDELDKLLNVLGDHPLSIELVGPHLKTLAPGRIAADFGRLLEQFTGDAEVERNRSLLASLRFSTDRLSAEARAALPWLGLFRVGVFEHNLLDVSQIEPGAWLSIRAELEATALIRVETEVQLADRPYLRFHPTLPWAANVVSSQHIPPLPPGEGRGEGPSTAGSQQSPPLPPEQGRGEGDLGANAEVRARFVDVYVGLDASVYRALRGSNPRGGMEVLAREEANFRTAVHWAAELGRYDVASSLGQTYGDYLERSARLRERDRWAAWLAETIRKAPFSEAAAESERNYAWSLFTQGQFAEAVQRLEALIERLERTKDFDPVFQLATARLQVGRIYQVAGESDRAIPILEGAVRDWERLCAAKGVDAREAFPVRQELDEDSAASARLRQIEPDDLKQAEAELGGLSATVGDLANALRAAGRLDEALRQAERAIAIDRALGHERELGAGLGQTAQILMEQGHYAEADARYADALEAARRAGDKDLQAALLQHQGSLADEISEYSRASKLYAEALKLSQEAGDEASEMRTSNLLGVLERNQGRLPEARAWYERSREIARRRDDQEMLGAAAQNIGIVCQLEGEAARAAGDEATARKRFEDAERSLHESLALRLSLRSKRLEAEAAGQLGQLYLLMGELDKAEEYADRAREIREEMGLIQNVPITYATLAGIARARGDERQAEEWEAKRAAVEEELERRARGDAPEGAHVAQRMLEAIQALAVACVQAAADRAPLPPEVESMLGKLESPDSPLRPLAAYLRRIAGTAPDQLASVLASPPAHVPEPLGELFSKLSEAVKEALG